MTKKESFIAVINGLMLQNDLDVKYASEMSNIYNQAEIPVYNNGVLVESLIRLIITELPNPSQAEQKIRCYMYEDNFGRHGNFSTNAEYLWRELNFMNAE
jgi:hypothetical protein